MQQPPLLRYISDLPPPCPVAELEHTTSVDHLQVSTGNPLEIPMGFLPVAPNQIVPIGQDGSG